MPRAKNTKKVTTILETVPTNDQNSELSAANGVEKAKRSAKKAEKAEEVLSNGISKGRGGKKAESSVEIPQSNEEVKEKKKESTKSKANRKVKKDNEIAVENEEVVEESKPKRGRGKKENDEVVVESKSGAESTTVESVNNGEFVKPDVALPKSKAVRGSKKPKKENVAETEEVNMEPSTSAVGKGRKRKEASAEQTVSIKESATTEKKTLRGKKRIADKPSKETSEELTVGLKATNEKKAVRGKKQTGEKLIETTAENAGSKEASEDQPIDSKESAIPEKKAARGKKRTADEPTESTTGKAKSAKKETAKPVKTKAGKQLQKEEIAETGTNPSTSENLAKGATARKRGGTTKAPNIEIEESSEPIVGEKPTSKRVAAKSAKDEVHGPSEPNENEKNAITARKRGLAKTAIVEITQPSEQNVSGEKTKNATTRKRGTAITANDEVDETAESKPSKAKKGLLNPTETTYNKADFELADTDKNSSNVSSSGVERRQLKISSWNVAGLRSWLKKDGLKYLEYEDPDIFCLQEIKCTVDQMPEEAQRIPGYHPYWLSLPGGYAGVALYSKIMPINVEYGIGNDEFDNAGRLITAEYEKFYLINVYVPNSGRKLVNLEARMRWEKLFQGHVKKFDARKPVIICGDMNVSHQEIDLANPKSNTRSAGFTIEEREKMTELLSLGFVDTFRHLYPNKLGAYTYWTYMANARSRNVGWRLDYFLVSERFNNRIIENAIRSQVMGSDHCPITLFANI